MINSYQEEIKQVYESLNKTLEPYYKFMKNYCDDIQKTIEHIKNIIKNIQFDIPNIPSLQINDVVTIMNQYIYDQQFIIPITFDLKPINPIYIPVEIRIVDGNEIIDRINGYISIAQQNN